jgi:release factor glutamine methyltransferase
MNALQILRQRYGLGEARALYELIMERRFGLSRTDILLGKDTTLSAEDKAELEIIVDRVAKGEPVQYVLGCADFCGREFLVGPGVLIPRPETQELVRLVEQHLALGSTVLDIGTGSGCIAITLALAGYEVTALDVSDVALSFARRNAERLGAEVEFVKGDILKEKSEKLKVKNNSNLPKETENESNSDYSLFTFHFSLDAIVSNPPYICESEASAMDGNVLDHEPHLALFVPDHDPLLFYRAISEFGLEHLAADGLLFFEVNRAHAEQVAELLLQKGYRETKIVKDQYDNNRFVCARKIQD